MEEKSLLLQTNAELEKMIRKVKGVISSRVVSDEKGNITEIHVLAESNRSPKQIVRDIESSLLVQAEINIDHKKISVVQTKEADDQQEDCRPKLVGINLLISGLNAEAKVQLSIGDSAYEGLAVGPNTTSNRLRLVATATLDALENYLDERAKFIVEDLVKIPLGRKEAVNVSISVITSQGENILLGSSFIKQDDREAVGKATLNAVNRKISLLNIY